MAWAAVVMLSVALVLQIAKVPTPEAVTFERDSSKLEVTSPEFEKAGSNLSTPIEMNKSTAKQAPLGPVPGNRQHSKLRLERVDEQEMPAAAASITLESAVTGTCSEEMTAAPASWLECIEGLEKAGRVEEANEQRRQLQISFPDFELP